MMISTSSAELRQLAVIIPLVRRDEAFPCHFLLSIYLPFTQSHIYTPFR
jgi:hypothetical protein